MCDGYEKPSVPTNWNCKNGSASSRLKEDISSKATERVWRHGTYYGIQYSRSVYSSLYTVPWLFDSSICFLKSCFLPTGPIRSVETRNANLTTILRNWLSKDSPSPLFTALREKGKSSPKDLEEPSRFGHRSNFWCITFAPGNRAGEKKSDVRSTSIKQGHSFWLPWPQVACQHHALAQGLMFVWILLKCISFLIA